MAKENDKSNAYTLEKAFQYLNTNYIKINNKERLYNNAILYKVLDTLLIMMQNSDVLFSSLQPKLEYMGSYFEGLRVGHPTEFDINLTLKFPVNYKKIRLDSGETPYGCYTYIIMPSDFRRLYMNVETAEKGFHKTNTWCDAKSHRLSVSKVRSWMQGVVDAALSQLPVKDGKRILKIDDTIFKLQSKLAGPANNVTIIQEDKDILIDIDLVPTFAFELPKKPLNCEVDFKKKIFWKLKQYFVVPKPTDNDYCWRLTFPYQERMCLNNKGYLKSVLKLLKLLRDTQNFKALASYYIKTLFLWEVSQSDETFWKSKSLNFLVLYMMSKLQIALSQHKLCNFWCPDHNLIANIKKETCKNWANRLIRIIRRIKCKNIEPSIVFEYFIKRHSEVIYI